MKLSILLLLTVVALSACSSRSNTSMPAGTSSSTQSREAQTAELQAKLKGITVTDGISKSEAELIAECYFHRNVGCGDHTGIRDGGDFWIVDGAFGYAAKPIQGFHIGKTNGKITSPIGPSYATPFEIFPQTYQSRWSQRGRAVWVRRKAAECLTFPLPVAQLLSVRRKP